MAAVTPEELALFKLAYSMLAAAQWGVHGGTDVTYWGCCVVCAKADWRGHAADCDLKALLDEMQPVAAP